MSSRPGRALVIGASGFLGSRLLALAPRDIDLVGTGHDRPVREGPWRDARLDVRSPTAIRALVQRERPQAVFYVSYDRSDRTITVDGAYEAARAAAEVGARFLLTSTDLVFDGARGNYTEKMPAMPLMPYGQLKVEAEVAVWAAAPEAVILRPSIMIGESGPMRRPAFECEALDDGRPVDLYEDEWRSPLWVDDAARAAWDLVLTEVTGPWHVGGHRMTRLELGRVLCTLYGYDPSLLRPAKRPADRPSDTSLDGSRLAALLGWSPRVLEPESVLAGV